MTENERRILALNDVIEAAIAREIRRWDGLRSQGDLQAAAPSMAKCIRIAIKRSVAQHGRVNTRRAEQTKVNQDAARGMRWLES